MIAALDVQYDEAHNVARTGLVLFSSWTDPTPDDEQVRTQQGFAEYVPGQFYKRELPCLLPLLEPLIEQLSVVVVDGFVDLAPADDGAIAPLNRSSEADDAEKSRAGLGRHLHWALKEKVDVVGVAKSPFLRHEKAPGRPVLRGRSKRPLWVTATYDVNRAALQVRNMAGPDRLPDLLRRVDHLARGR
jgi:deoxyribonuclease V